MTGFTADMLPVLNIRCPLTSFDASIDRQCDVMSNECHVNNRPNPTPRPLLCCFVIASAGCVGAWPLELWDWSPCPGLYSPPSERLETSRSIELDGLTACFTFALRGHLGDPGYVPGYSMLRLDALAALPAHGEEAA